VVAGFVVSSVPGDQVVPKMQVGGEIDAAHATVPSPVIVYDKAANP